MKHAAPDALRFLSGALEDLAAQGLLRTRNAPATSSSLSFCSNDYLALADRPSPPAARGAGASRLVNGERAEHEEAERAIAAFVGLPQALVFTSGYAANLGTLAALARPGDLVVSDAQNHASIIDGIRLSRADVVVVPHLDIEGVGHALAAPRSGRRLVVTESYFSMDADSPDLAELRDLCDRAGAVLMVDEAHALGVLGPSGRGVCKQLGIEPDILVGTFGKAFGAGGAFVAGCPELISWLWNRARSFVFSTGLSPAVAAAAAEGVRAGGEDPERRERVLANATYFRAGLAELGVEPLGYGHIVPWVLGDPARALRIAAALQAWGIDARAIRPPTVPTGTARLRFTVTAAHGRDDLDRTLGAIGRVLQVEGRARPSIRSGE